MPRIRELTEVVDWRLCLGCGACAYICPDDRVRLVDFLSEGIRPVVESDGCGDCRQCLEVCPAVQSDFRPAGLETDHAFSNAFTKEWGPVVAIWEGHATDPGIRYKGSSGGALTAIGAYCVEVLGMHGVLHIAQDPDEPIRNRTRLSRTRGELLAATGSRYSPASVCNGLDLVEAAPAPCAVIGRPSEIAAVRNASQLRPELGRKVGVTLSFFCAESPSTRGTVALLQKLGVEPASVCDLRYRGYGWPGHFAPTVIGKSEPCQKMTYRESWAFLQAFRPWSLQLWPDGTGELADISCGDPWYEEPDGKNPGFSLVMARTARGCEIIEGAIAKGYLTLKPAENWKLVKSQSNLLAKKGSVWGRLLALRLFGLPATRFEGLNLWHCWLRLSFGEKLRSTLGTVRRILSRKLYRPMKLNPRDGVRSKPPVAAMETKASEGTGFSGFQARPSLEAPSRINPVRDADEMLDRPSPRICLMGTAIQCENRGVLALAASLVGLVWEECPDAQISLLIGNRDKIPFRVKVGGTMREVPVVNYRLSSRSNPRDHLSCILILSVVYRLIPISALRGAIRRAIPWIRAVAEADLVGDIRGGDSFSDIYGMYRFLDGFFPVLAVILVHGKIVLLPQTYGPFGGRIARAMARWIMQRSSAILARDRQSVEVIRPLLGERCREVVYCPDVAFALQADCPREFGADSPLRHGPGAVVVGFNVNGLMYNGGYTRNNMFGLKMDYRALLPELLLALLQEPAIEVLLVPHTYGTPGTVESDSDASLKVREALPKELQGRIHLVTANYDQHELKGIIGTCDFFIGSRMHACIAALSQSIPCVGIAYSRKFKGVFDSVGMADWVVDGRTVDNPTAVKRVMSLYQDREKAREMLQTRVEQAQGQLRETFARLLSATAHRRGSPAAAAYTVEARPPAD